MWCIGQYRESRCSRPLKIGRWTRTPRGGREAKTCHVIDVDVGVIEVEEAGQEAEMRPQCRGGLRREAGPSHCSGSVVTCAAVEYVPIPLLSGGSMARGSGDMARVQFGGVAHAVALAVALCDEGVGRAESASKALLEGWG